MKLSRMHLRAPAKSFDQGPPRGATLGELVMNRLTAVMALTWRRATFRRLTIPMLMSGSRVTFTADHEREVDAVGADSS